MDCIGLDTNERLSVFTFKMNGRGETEVLGASQGTSLGGLGTCPITGEAGSLCVYYWLIAPAPRIKQLPKRHSTLNYV